MIVEKKYALVYKLLDATKGFFSTLRKGRLKVASLALCQEKNEVTVELITSCCL
jgi:hypothetical protein